MTILKQTFKARLEGSSLAEGYRAREAASNTNAEKAKDQVLRAQMEVLQSADVLVLNEVDWGMKRSDYRAVVKDLADALKMNWAYGVWSL